MRRAPRKDNMSKEMKERLRREYTGLGGGDKPLFLIGALIMVYNIYRTIASPEIDTAEDIAASPQLVSRAAAATSACIRSIS